MLLGTPLVRDSPWNVWHCQRSRALEASLFFFPLLRITLLSLHISSYLLLYSYSTRSHHSQYSQLNVVFMNGNYDFYPVTKKVIVFKLQIFCPKTPAPPTIPDSRAVILYLRLCFTCNTVTDYGPLLYHRCDKMWQTNQTFPTVGYSFENPSTVAMWLETAVAEQALTISSHSF